MLASNESVKLQHPFRMLVSGSSGTGKTTFVRDLLKDFRHTTTIDENTLHVTYMYGQEQAVFAEPISSHVIMTYVKGFNDDFDDKKPDIIVIDDLMAECGDEKRLTSLFTKGSHHMGISVIYLVQNLFHKGKEMRTISLNSQYIVTMRNPRDRLQVMALGRQVFPTKSKFFNACFDAALNEPFSHLIIDITPTCSDDMRLRQRNKVKGQKGFTIFLPS